MAAKTVLEMAVKLFKKCQGSNQQYSVPELKQIHCDTSLVDCLYWTKAQKNSQSIELPVTTYELRVTTYIKVGVTFLTLFSLHVHSQAPACFRFKIDNIG